MENNFEKLKYKRAKKRMQEIKAFYIMLGGCCLLTPYLIFINMKINPEIHWFWFPVFGFIVSVFGYALYLFLGNNWEEKKLQQLMEEERKNKKSL